eukprot:CAMPEP_0172649884 /NCGR_PEP_ID=MMETSP1068-20121228/242011_1 /TAXON_ID=35684 /ORGANISM="Pseudopedinella elastica, Strain CCMP716" /LENGTH=764 /DNA_ID=CAMNT_0013464245 /DNA_START=247 /DNA_END=2541 /DNA_ORIENTATION=+
MIFSSLSRASSEGCSHDQMANEAPEESERLPLLNRGVSPGFLVAVLQELVGMKREESNSGQLVHGNHTTDSKTDWQLFDRQKDPFSIKACTLHTGTSFVETCIKAGLTHDPVTGEAYFGPINTFVSYTWRGQGTTFAALVESVLSSFGDQSTSEEPESAKRFMFVDIMACAQNRRPRSGSGTCPNATDVGQFLKVLNSCTSTVFFGRPLTKPLALQRVWCLYEIMATAQLNKNFVFALGAEDRVELENMLIEQPRFMLTLFSDIDAEKAEATNPEDKEMIFEMIRDSVGFKALNKLVMDKMREWVRSTSIQLVKDAEDEINANQESVGRERVLGVGALCFGLASAFRDLGEHGEAKVYFSKSLKLRRSAISSPHDPEIIECITGIGVVASDDHDYEATQSAYSEALSLAEALVQDIERAQAEAQSKADAEAAEQRGASTSPPPKEPRRSWRWMRLRSRSTVASHSFKKELEAASLGPKCSLAEAKEIQASCVLMLGQTSLNIGDLDTAQERFSHCLGLQEAHGALQSTIARTLVGLGQIAQRQGDFTTARQIFARSLAMREESLGRTHPDTARGRNNLAEVLLSLGDHQGAVESFQICLDIQEATLPATHHRIAITHLNLADALEARATFRSPPTLPRASPPALAVAPAAAPTASSEERAAAVGPRLPAAAEASGASDTAAAAGPAGPAGAVGPQIRIVLLRKALAHAQQAVAILSPQQSSSASSHPNAVRARACLARLEGALGESTANEQGAKGGGNEIEKIT